MESKMSRGHATLVIFIFLLPCSRGTASDSWAGLNPSLSTRARSATGVTSPLSENLADWAKRNLADASWISKNPALVSSLHHYDPVFQPIYVNTGNSGNFTTLESLKPRILDSDQLRTSFESSDTNAASSRFEMGARYFEKGLGVAVAYSAERSARELNSNEIFFKAHRDFSLQFAAAGPIFEKDNFGRLEFGTGLKVIMRKGDEIIFSTGQISQSLEKSALTQITYSGGLDYGLLYSAPRALSGDWKMQIGLAWIDVGSTQFFLGNKASTGRRFEALPNNQIIGLGLGTPNIWGGVRAGFRLEYREWKRNVSVIDKLASSVEVRLPELLAVSAGLQGRRFSAGAIMRFPHIEIEIISAVELLGNSGSHAAPRTVALELRNAF